MQSKSSLITFPIVRDIAPVMSLRGPQNGEAMDEGSLAILRREFEAHDGSFLIQLRPWLTWDKAAFSRLITAMEQCCRTYADNDLLDRWIAQGFWYIPTFVKNWTTHPNFPRVHEQAYYDMAYQRLDDLAFWFFLGQSPYIGDAGFDPL